MSTATQPQNPQSEAIIPPMETVSCYICDVEFPRESCTEFDAHYLCSECLENETFICERCESRDWNDNNSGDGDLPLCESCYDNSYTRCTECECVIHREETYYLDEDDEFGYCEYCYDKQKETRYVHNYNYKPVPVFLGESANNRYFGVELEIDTGGKDNENAHDLLRIVNNDYEDKIYIKLDGSLNNGFEIVTHPMTLDYHMIEMDWEELTQTALNMGYKSHKTDTCGLHVHVNRNTFTDNYTMQESCIGRVLFIVERFWEELLRFSRRTENQIRQWANRYGFKHEPRDILDTAKKSCFNRYTCVNITNTTTIEFRIFRGTLKSNTIIATLQLVNHICDLAFSLSNDNISKLSWVDFVEGIEYEKYPELIRYMKERRLYINEEITTEEDE